jgi:NAD(P)-dependent dehydrogenase (short-subunit alcohol dehydrogenase family)
LNTKEIPVNQKKVFVTGAGRGIGRAIALKLSGLGYQVAGSARSREELESLNVESGGKISVSTLDVRDSAAQKDWFEREVEPTARTSTEVVPWGLVTAAGIYGPIGPITENSMEEWTNSLEINLMGTVWSVRLFSQLLVRKERPGRIALLSGGGATQPMANFTSYCATKAAVVRFGETVAYELQKYDITVNSIAPGAVNTKLTEEVVKAGPEKSGAEMYQKTQAQLESGGVGSEKASALTAFLMSEESRAVTGRLISAVWDPWQDFPNSTALSTNKDLYTLRRIAK